MTGSMKESTKTLKKTKIIKKKNQKNQKKCLRPKQCILMHYLGLEIGGVSEVGLVEILLVVVCG